jgi:hypothetical protein
MGEGVLTMTTRIPTSRAREPSAATPPTPNARCGGEELFLGAGLDLPSLLMGERGWELGQCRRENYPKDWSGGHMHTHRAIDDALGYANVLSNVLRRRAGKR